MATVAFSLASEAASPLLNLAKCGTISQIGCVKESQTNAEESAWAAAIQSVYAVELGRATPAAAQQQISQFIQALQQAGVGIGGSFAGFCGQSGWAVSNPWAGIPDGSKTRAALCPAATSAGSVYDLMKLAIAACAAVSGGVDATGGAPVGSGAGAPSSSVTASALFGSGGLAAALKNPGVLIVGLLVVAALVAVVLAR